MTLKIRTLAADDFAPLTFDEALALTDEIRVSVADLEMKIVQAYYGRAWTALEYESWDEYIQGEFKTAPLALPREDRKTQVASLRSQGLSLRAIASATGVDHKTVKNDLDSPGEFSPPAQVTGIDGKSYAAERPATRTQEVRDMPPEAREACPYCGQDLPDRLQIPPNRRRQV